MEFLLRARAQLCVLVHGRLQVQFAAASNGVPFGSGITRYAITVDPNNTGKVSGMVQYESLEMILPEHPSLTKPISTAILTGAP